MFLEALSSTLEGTAGLWYILRALKIFVNPLKKSILPPCSKDNLAYLI